ncbi:MAG: aminoacyl-tRNA hydrolase [Lachnospiraceae bacterium]|nr:aminoacyl-tRNA hydrolase [Lachnospiraceae bacterium]
MIVVVGLGNPGLRYAKTRHNVGFMMIDRLMKKYSVKLKDNKKKALVGVCTIDGQKVALVKPLTFMNASGNAVSAVMEFYRADPETELIVLCDDVSLPPGTLRIRKKGSAGGHNGLKDIIAKCHTEGFTRIKFGVGEAPEGMDLANYVLGRFSLQERKQLEEAMERAEEALPMILQGDIDRAMNRFNEKQKH